MDDDGQIIEAHSISAGLDYPGIGPEHSWLHDMGRVNYVSATDAGGARRLPAVLQARRHHSGARTPHALARVMKIAPSKPEDHLMVMNMCGRGDKDIFTVAAHLGVKL